LHVGVCVCPVFIAFMFINLQAWFCVPHMLKLLKRKLFCCCYCFIVASCL